MHSLPTLPTDLNELIKLRIRVKRRKLILLTTERCEKFSEFVRAAWPVLEPGRPLVWSRHLDIICEYLEAVYAGQVKRLIVNIPFRTSKSTLISKAFPAWVWSRKPSAQFLTLAHSDDLAVRDATATRNLIESEWYQERWGQTYSLASDQNQKHWYQNSKNGHRNAQGLGGSITGKGGDFIGIDDPHDQEKAQSDAYRQTVLDAYDQKVSTRLNDPATGAIYVVMQRLHTLDLTGHLLRGEEKWEHVVLPMQYTGKRYTSVLGPKGDDWRTTPGELLDATRFPEPVIAAFKSRLGTYGSAGQLQQSPTPAGGGILKAAHWRQWPTAVPLPKCEHVFQSYDTAYSEEDHKKAAYSARTTWGIFLDDKSGKHCALLLEAWADRVDYYELRKLAKESYNKWRPDRVLIEKKASGISLVQDMRRGGIPVSTYSPDRDKIARAYAVQPMLESGLVWLPDRKWAEAVRDHASAFPTGAPPSADYTDTITQALLYLRNSWWVHQIDDLPKEQPTLTDEDIVLFPKAEKASVKRIYG